MPFISQLPLHKEVTWSPTWMALIHFFLIDRHRQALSSDQTSSLLTWKFFQILPNDSVLSRAKAKDRSSRTSTRKIVQDPHD